MKKHLEDFLFLHLSEAFGFKGLARQYIVHYNLPVHLIAIAPTFHRDNLIDRQYHRLEFQFLDGEPENIHTIWP